MSDLTKVWRACRSLESAQTRLRDAIREARNEGATLRDIAIAAGVSYETVPRICEQ